MYNNCFLSLNFNIETRPSQTFKRGVQGITQVRFQLDFTLYLLLAHY